MIEGTGIDSYQLQHKDNDPHTYDLDLSEYDKYDMDQRNTHYECKTPHLRNYTESLSLVSMHRSPILSVKC